MQFSHRVFALASALAVTACSEPSPVGPDSRADDVRLAAQFAASGSYAISFLKETATGLAPAADTEPVGTYLVLRSEVRDAAGNLATSGTVTYQYCSLSGDFAPSSACATGSGQWKRWGSGPVDPVGTRFGFGSCSTPRTIGFRVTYSGRKSGIANGASAPRDFTWQ
ncbi:MAG TPA: hypothetical protein VGC52_03290 [Gemmatimonadaceae bacterium]